MVFGARAVLVSCDDDGDLAEDVPRARRELAERAAAHLLVVLGELAAQRGGAVRPEDLGHARESRGGPAG